MTGNKDDRHVAVALPHDIEQLQTAHSRQAYIADDRGGRVFVERHQRLFRTAEGSHFQIG